jgi:cytochrome c
VSIQKSSLLLASSLLIAFGGLSTAQAAVDADAAQALLKKSACLTCHAIDKKKVATAYKEVAKKYKDKADAEDKLIKHITAKPMVEMGGTKVEHMAIKSDDPAAIRNVVQWILSL